MEAGKGKEVGGKGLLLRGKIGGEGRERRKGDGGKGSGGEASQLFPLEILCDDINI